MPDDDLIHCPACNFQLRLPTDLYGTAVECPRCHTRFTAPVPAVRPAGDRPPPGREYDAGVPVARSDDYRPRSGGGLTAAAIALLITSLLSTAFYGYMAIAFVEVKRDPADFDQAMKDAIDNNPNIQPNDRARAHQWALWMRENGLAVCATEAAINFVTLLGAALMLARRGYPLGILGCLLALNPTNCPGCFLQVPFGIWGLVALFSESGRRAFRGR
ncbi:MAG TPA: hypothetical protein VH120_02355 [Gemmataceae bacterium]|jgi:hypothetical protein|nr:hypothetical protein [Gemmataceae bacterium]